MTDSLPFKTTPVIQQCLQQLVNAIKTADEYGQITNGEIKGFVRVVEEMNVLYVDSLKENKELFLKYLETENIARINRPPEGFNPKEEEIFAVNLEETPDDVLRSMPTHCYSFDAFILDARKVVDLQKRVVEEYSKTGFPDIQKDEQLEEVLKKGQKALPNKLFNSLTDNEEIKNIQTKERYITLDEEGDFYYGKQNIKINFESHNLLYYRVFLTIFILSKGCGLAKYSDIIEHMRKAYSNKLKVDREAIRNAVNNSIRHRASDLRFPLGENGVPTLQCKGDGGVTLNNPLLSRK